MANDQRDLGAVRAIAYRDAEVARLPRLDGDPRMEFSVVEYNLAVAIDDQAAVIGVAGRVGFHNGKATPNRVRVTSATEGRDFGALESAHQSRIGVHRQAVQRILGEDDEVHRRHAATSLCHHRTDALDLPFQL
jgi:hypothetical protein